MVVHFSSNLSSKLSHLAQSFRPQQHFNFIRNAVPSSGSSTTTYTNSSLGQAGNGQAAGTGSNGSAGGAGGAKYNAGNRSHPNWGFQVRSFVLFYEGKEVNIDLFLFFHCSPVSR